MNTLDLNFLKMKMENGEVNKRRANKIYKIKNELIVAKSSLEFILDEEQEAYDNYPESLQGTDRYERMESSIEFLENATDSINEAIDALDEIV